MKIESGSNINRTIPITFIATNTLIVLLLIVLSGCTEKNNLMIFNTTETSIVVVNAKVNGKIIANKELLVRPRPKRYSPVTTYAHFRAANSSVLEIEIKGQEGVINARCTLNITPGGCLFSATYVGTNQLKCNCDSYADFKS